MLKYLAVKLIRVLLRVFYIFPVVPNRILFMSYGGAQYACNPKYLYLYLKEKQGNQLRCIWALTRKTRAATNWTCSATRLVAEQVPQNAPRFAVFNGSCSETEVSEQLYCSAPSVEPGSLRYYYYYLTSQVIVSNQPINTFIPLRKSQKYVNTWHGGGAFKSLAPAFERADRFYQSRLKAGAEQTALYLSSCAKGTEVIASDSKIPPEKILECGMPRNDIFFGDYSKTRADARSRFGLLPGQALLLYAPTYRGAPGSMAFDNILDASACAAALNARFAVDTVVFFRAHHAAAGALNLNYASVVDVSDYPDMQELLCAADFLITDYSSCMWDFALTGKPGFLFVPDIEKYYGKERAFYTPIESWPYPFARTNGELAGLIRGYDEKAAGEKIAAYQAAVGSFERGTASETVGGKITAWCLRGGK